MNRQTGHNEDTARRRNIYAKKHLQSDLDAQRDMERVHLQTIRNEKIKLQKELERMRNKGQYMVKRHGASNHTQRLLKLRFTSEQSDTIDGDDESDQDNESTTRFKGLPEITQSKNGGKSLTREQRMIDRRRREAEKRQDALVAKVGKLAEDFKDNDMTPLRRRSLSPVATSSDTKSEGAQTSKSDGFYTSSRWQPNRTSVRPTRTSSFVDIDLTQAKNSVARRLLQTNSLEEASDGETATRKVSRALPINDAEQSDNTELPHFAEDLVFDQDTFAPDGHMRTVHLLPDSNEAFREAKKARYLRWRGPDKRDRELSVGEIFGEERVQ